METLNVYLRGRCTGALTSDKGRLAFTYAEAYLLQPEAGALSYTMPLRYDRAVQDGHRASLHITSSPLRRIWEKSGVGAFVAVVCIAWL